ncbi:hypothetical protein TNCV_2048431 [Trichonephila clavipes]|nr:hypothetical protein TNCV_2048431 [Trichonephila clavipes]
MLLHTVGSLVVRASDSRPEGLGVPLGPCHDEFRGPRSVYVTQVALETTTKDPKQYSDKMPKTMTEPPCPCTVPTYHARSIAS